MKRQAVKCLILALAAILIELFVFNFRTFESLSFSPVEGFTLSDANGQRLTSGQTVTFSAQGSSELILNNINANAQNIYIDAALSASPEATLTLQLWARDEGNNQYYRLPKVDVSPLDPDSRYIKLNLSGEARSIKITFQELSGETLTIRDIEINRFRPLDFSILRLAGIFIVLLMVYGLRPSSGIYNLRYASDDQRQRILLTVLLFAQLTVAAGVTVGNETYCDPPWKHHYQYHELAVAMTEGHFYLNEEPSAELMAMDNPYDRYERKAQKVNFLWDTAYYEGKYYSYFGVLPVFVYYLPYYLLTGEAFPTFVGIILNCAAIIAGAYFLLDVMVRKYFRHTSLGLFVLLEIMLALGCGLLLIVNPPTFYNMPAALGLALTLWGLYFWFRAVGKLPGQLDRRFLVIGGTFMALVAACRPQLLVGSFLILPLMARTFKQRLAASKRTALADLAAAAVPYIIVAALLMYYNAARFGSPFDFGANYNLTTNDMTHRGFHLDRLPFGLFTYLLQPPEISGRAPFMTSVTLSTAYQGTTIAETMYGGFFWFNLITAALLFYGNARAFLRKRGLALFCALSAILALVVVCADIQMAGILQRYGCDFGLFFTLPAVIIALALHEKLDLCQRRLQKSRPVLAAAPSPKAAFGNKGRLAAIYNKVLLWLFWLTLVVNALWLWVK